MGYVRAGRTEGEGGISHIQGFLVGVGRFHGGPGPQRRCSHCWRPLKAQRKYPGPSFPPSLHGFSLVELSWEQLPREPPATRGSVEQAKSMGWIWAPTGKAHVWRASQVLDAAWLPDGQCPSLTFLMSSERKLQAYFTEGGCFMHRGCFTVCDEEHSVGCWRDSTLSLP